MELFCYFVFVYFYLMTLGYLTVLESKILGVVQLSSGPFSMSFFNIYHFYLDFLKIVVKGFFDKMVLSQGHILGMTLLILVNTGASIFLPFNVFGEGFFYGFLFYWALDSLVLVFKMYIFSLFGSKFQDATAFGVKSMYVVLEGVFICFYFYMILVGVVLGGKTWMGFKVFSVGSLPILALYGEAIFILVLFKLFSTPFDYFEAESEFVGGGALEFFGVGFSLWSLVEYGLIFNNSMFVSGVVSLLFSGGTNQSLFQAMMTILVFVLVFFASGVLLSVSFHSVFWGVMKGYYLSVLLFCVDLMLMSSFVWVG